MAMEPGSPGALTGLTVAEWGRGRAAAYTGRLLCGHGARVILVEPGEDQREQAVPVGPEPAADCQLDARIRFLHGGKQSVQLDPFAADQREPFFRILETVDILLLEQSLDALDAAGLSPEALSERFPALVVVAVSLAGLTPDARSLRGGDLIAHAMSGVAFATGGIVESLETPPIRPGGYQAEYTTGMAAASAALLGVRMRRRTGRGGLFDTSMQATLASFMRMNVAYRLYEASDSMGLGFYSRLAKGSTRATLWNLVPCKDGYFAFQASEQWQWDGLMKMMGYPAWSKLPEFAEPLDRAARWDEIEPHFVGWCLEHTKTEIFHTAQANHVPVFPCYNVEELNHDAQFEARGFLVELPEGPGHQLVRVPGAVLHMEKTPWSHDGEPPAVGQHTAAILGALEAKP